MNRREFLESSTAAAAGLGIFRWTPAPPSDRPTLRPAQARLQQYTSEAPFDKLPTVGLSAEYVRRETRRAVAGVGGGKTKIWPGIEIDIPTGEKEKKTTPEDVYGAVKATFEGGAHGIILSRKYSEMRLENLRAAGRAVRDTVKRA